MKISTILAGVGVFAGIILVGSGLGVYKYRTIKAAEENQQVYEPAEAVQIGVAEEMQWRPMADLVGTVISMRSVRVSNELAGRVSEVRFESGAIVEAGDVILMLDDTIERADTDAALASVRVAEASVAVLDTRLRLARSELERMSGAADARAVSAMDLDRAKTEVDRAIAERDRLVAEVDQAKARVAQMEARLHKMVIKAPFKARAGLRSVHEGQYLAEGTDVVMLEEVSDRIYLDFPVPQEYAPRVAPGLVVMATSDVFGPEPVRIEVVAVDAVVNNNTRNLRVRAVVDNADGRLRAGMFVQVRVPVEDAKPYVMVPATAVRRSSFADNVFIVTQSTAAGDPPGTLRSYVRFVKLGPTVGDKVIVLDGLKVGEQIASTGSFKLREGAKVAPAPAPASTTAPAPSPTH